MAQSYTNIKLDLAFSFFFYLSPIYGEFFLDDKRYILSGLAALKKLFFDSGHPIPVIRHRLPPNIAIKQCALNYK